MAALISPRSPRPTLVRRARVLVLVGALACVGVAIAFGAGGAEIGVGIGAVEAVGLAGLARLVRTVRARITTVVILIVVTLADGWIAVEALTGLRWYAGVPLIATMIALLAAAALLLHPDAAAYHRHRRPPRQGSDQSTPKPRTAYPPPPVPVASRPPAPKPAGAIFISYRRADSLHPAHRLHDYLSERFGEQSLFMDLDTIRPGADFVATIDTALHRCRVLLVVIGSEWATSADQGGRRRLDDPGDYVRLEIETGLRRDLLVIPVLVDAPMPSPQSLPAALRGLAQRNAVELRGKSFRSDCTRLADHIDQALAGNT